MILAEAAQAAAEPSWLPTVLGVVALVSGAGAFAQWRDRARVLKQVALVGYEVLDAIDGDDTPEERAALYRAFLARHGSDKVFLRVLADSTGGGPPAPLSSSSAAPGGPPPPPLPEVKP